MRIIFHAFLVVLFISCNTNKTYKYIEHVNDPDLTGGYTPKDEDPIIINAASDEDAYVQAYEKYAISKKVFEEMNKNYGLVKEPISFQLLNDKNEDISGLFINDSAEKNIDNTVSAISLNIDSPKIAAFKYSTGCPVKILSSRPVEQDYSSFRDIHLSWKNTSKKTIVGIKFKWEGINAFGEPADVGNGRGFSDDKLRPGKSDYGEWSILSRDLKKVTRAWVYEVAFEDGTKWTLDEHF
jgi:hypothetical protein